VQNMPYNFSSSSQQLTLVALRIVPLPQLREVEANILQGLIRTIESLFGGTRGFEAHVNVS
jgi:hypothetical protein